MANVAIGPAAATAASAIGACLLRSKWVTPPSSWSTTRWTGNPNARATRAWANSWSRVARLSSTANTRARIHGLHAPSMVKAGIHR